MLSVILALFAPDKCSSIILMIKGIVIVSIFDCVYKMNEKKTNSMWFLIVIELIHKICSAKGFLTYCVTLVKVKLSLIFTHWISKHKKIRTKVIYNQTTN